MIFSSVEVPSTKSRKPNPRNLPNPPKKNPHSHIKRTSPGITLNPSTWTKSIKSLSAKTCLSNHENKKFIAPISLLKLKLKKLSRSIPLPKLLIKGLLLILQFWSILISGILLRKFPVPKRNYGLRLITVNSR